MTIAELFVNLGVKGDGEAQKAMGGVKNTLGDMTTGAIAAKAAIIGAIYALQRMMSQSAAVGMGLQQFANFTGLSAETLQRWQYAARQAGVSAEELQGSVKAVQGNITNMLLGKGAPEGMAIVSNTLAKMGKAIDPTKMRDTFYMMTKLQEFAKATAGSPDVANKILASFGLSEGVIQAMRKNAFTRDQLAKAPVYGNKEITQLAKVEVAWSNLIEKIKMAIGHLTAKHGMTLVNDISKVATQVLRMVDAFAHLAEKLKLLQILGKSFEGWEKIFDGIANAVERISGDKEGATHGVLQETGKLTQGAEGVAKDIWSMLKESYNTHSADLAAGLGLPVTPNMAQAPNAKVQNINVNQNLNFHHDGKDAKRTGDSVHDAVQKSYRQLQAQGQGA